MMFAPAAQKDLLYPTGFKVSHFSLLISTIAINILSLALPVMTLQIYDRIVPNPGLGTVNILIGGVCLAVILEMILRISRCYLLGWASASYEHRLSCSAIGFVINGDLSHRREYGTGEFLHRMGAISKLKDFYNGNSFITLTETVFVPAYMGLIIYIAGPLAFVPAAVLMIFTVVSLWQGQRLRKSLKYRDRTDDRRYDFLIESLEGIHTLKAMALENVFSRRYEALEEDSTIANYNVTQSTSSAFDTSAIFSNIMVACVICTGAIFAVNGQITTGTLIATILLSGRMMQPVQRALGLWIRYQDYTLSREKVEQIFETPQTVFVGADNKITPANDGKIDIRDLGFRSDETGSWLITDTDLTLDIGSTILLDSSQPQENGVLFDLMSGLYAPSRGQIMIDGQNVLLYPPEKLINHIGIMQGEGVIFRGTIRDNMTCFGLIEEKKAQEIASLLRVDRDIAGLPSGFDTFLNGNSTDTISPGLKQRIAMVRILAPKPRIILFDNADRFLDREGYNLVHSLLAQLKGKATLILISDDLNIRSLAEKYYAFEQGVLTELNPSNPKHKIKAYRELRI
jgi:ATP-binding cassette subfamily C protein LapB